MWLARPPSSKTLCARTLAVPRGQWLLAEHTEAASELRVSIFDEGTIHHCTIGRTFVDEQGVRWIVDYSIRLSPRTACSVVQGYRKSSDPPPGTYNPLQEIGGSEPD
jgi:hypothetical protein